MELHLKFDEKTLFRYDERGSEPFFEIYFEFCDECFPSEGWMDFGTVVLGWWIMSMIRMLQGSTQEEFLFMDGPYSLKTEYDVSSKILKLKPKGSNNIWKISFFELSKIIIRAANKACRELSRLGIAKESCKGLETGIKELRNKIKYSKIISS